jgi:hypothetical protein
MIINPFKKDEEAELIRNLIRIMQEFGWTLDELKHMSLPALVPIINELNRQSKEMERKSRKR